MPNIWETKFDQIYSPISPNIKTSCLTLRKVLTSEGALWCQAPRWWHQCHDSRVYSCSRELIRTFSGVHLLWWSDWKKLRKIRSLSFGHVPSQIQPKYRMSGEYPEFNKSVSPSPPSPSSVCVPVGVASITWLQLSFHTWTSAPVLWSSIWLSS